MDMWQSQRACLHVQLPNCVLALAKEAAARISLRDHVATHPRLGVMDHIACHHLGRPDQADSSRNAAYRIAECISREIPSLPVIMYGDASPQKLRLQDIRRACGVEFKLGPTLVPEPMLHLQDTHSTNSLR